ncbi:MAG: TldD/PmbA family protein [Paracoccus sp. (in: a-proteobacteria)]|nr:TldD/PmbA family protein [Paracoccus sp. (in: a-proteobacteria)]
MLESLTDQLLDAARRAGALEAEAIAMRGHSLSVDVRGGRLEQAERAESVDVGLRVLIGGRQAIVSGTNHSSEALDEMAHRAVAMAREAPVDDTLGLAEASQLATDRDISRLELNDPAVDPGPSELEQAALLAEAAALGVAGVSVVESAGAGFQRRETLIAASNGFSGRSERSSHGVFCTAISGEGLRMERDYAGESRIHAADMPAPAEIGALAGTRAAERAGARKPPTGAFPVLYDERVAAGLIGHIIAAINGVSIARGSSWLRDAMDTAILPEALTITEQPHLPRMPASRLFDAEGLATAPRAIIDSGVLRGWLLDLSTARKLGFESTANAVRGLSSPPGPGVSNIVLSGGTGVRGDLIAEMGRGLVVTSLLGASINPTTGDYSRGASGFWVENGEISHPVNECTIAGNLRDMLRTARAADDARDWRSHRVPSLLIEGMTVAGA